MNKVLLKAMIAAPLFVMVLGLTFYMQFSKYNLGLEARGAQPVGFVVYTKYSADLLVSKYKSRQAVADFKASDTLPSKPDGWFKTDYVEMHGEKITGAAYEFSARASTTEESIQQAFRLAAQGETQRAAASYVRGDQIVSVYTSVLDMPDPNTAEAASSDGLAVIDLGGLEMRQLPQLSEHFTHQSQKPVRYKRFEANLGNQLRVFAISNAPLEDVAAVLSGLNIAMLQGYAAATQDAAPGPGQEAQEEVMVYEDSSGLTDRISKLFATKAHDDEVVAPRRMTCRMRKGSKHCFFPEED